MPASKAKTLGVASQLSHGKFTSQPAKVQLLIS